MNINKAKAFITKKEQPGFSDDGAVVTIDYIDAAEYLVIEVEKMREILKPILEQACLIGMCENTVSIDCDTYDEAYLLFDGLTELI